MAPRLAEEALPPRSQPIIAAGVAVGLVALALSLAAAGRRPGGLVHHDSPPHVPLSYAIDVNASGPRELTPLPGVGPALAARIVDHRTAHGPFRRPEDLLDVPGIGPATLERLRPHLLPLPGAEDPR